MHLSPGVYLLPAHLTPEEVDGTAKLLHELVPAIEGVWNVPWDKVHAGIGFPTGMVVITDIPDAEVGIERVLAPIEARYVLARAGPAHEKGFGWLERLVKPAVVSALRSAVRDPSDPDARYAIENAPIREAAALTADPLELVALVEGAIEHRIKHASEGLTREVYARSLYLMAGARLAERLSRVEGDDLRAAFGVLLSAGEGDPNDSSFRRGAAALARVGLADYAHGELALGPLARAAGTPGPIHEALVERVPPEAWSSFSADRRVRILEMETAGLPQGARSTALPTSISAPITGADALVVTVLEEEHDAALETLKEQNVTLEVLHVGGHVVHIAGIDLPPVRIALARLTSYGGFTAGAEVTRLVDTFVPSVVAMCGICTGMPGRVVVGDVIVADAFVHYDLPPGELDETAHLGWKLLYRLDAAWAHRVRASDRLPAGHKGRVRVGTLATGLRALHDPRAVRDLMASNRRVLGFEQEVEALHVVAEGRSIVAKGVADIAGDEKTDAATRRAAACAAAKWLIPFLLAHLPDAGR